MDGGRLRLIFAEYELLAAVEEDVIDEVEARFDEYVVVRRSSADSEPPLRGRREGARPSGMADKEDIVTLGLGGRSEEADDEGEGDMEIIDARLLLDGEGTSGRFFSGGPTAGGILLDRSSEPVRDAT